MESVTNGIETLSITVEAQIVYFIIRTVAVLEPKRWGADGKARRAVYILSLIHISEPTRPY